jgi:hypothetical protein
VPPSLSDEAKACIDACSACHDVCMETTAWLRMQGPGDEGQIGGLLDCAELCRLTANFLMRDSPLHSMACFLCADACRHAARDCERFDEDRMRKTAEACRRTADHCRRSAALAVAMI